MEETCGSTTICEGWHEKTDSYGSCARLDLESLGLWHMPVTAAKGPWASGGNAGKENAGVPGQLPGGRGHGTWIQVARGPGSYLIGEGWLVGAEGGFVLCFPPL